MTMPHFLDAIPSLGVPFPEDVVTTRAVRSDGLVAFFHFQKDMDLPPHSHGAQ